MLRQNKAFSAAAIVLLISLFAILFIISRDPIFSDEDSLIIGNFIEWFGVLYGVLLALVVVEVWRRYNIVNNEIDQEADALVLLLKTARYLKDQKYLRRLAKRVLDYANSVLDSESGDKGENRKINGQLDQVHAEVGEILRENQSSPALEAELIRYVNQAIDTRGDRIAHSMERIPKSLWIVVIFTSMVWLLGFFGLNIESQLLAIFLCGAAMFTVFAIIFIVADLDGLAGGQWRMQFDSFKVLRAEAQKSM